MHDVRDASRRTVAHSRPFGRLLRLVVGVLVLASIAPYFRVVGWSGALAGAVTVLGLIAVYALLHVVVSRRPAGINRWAGAVLALLPLVLVLALAPPPMRIGAAAFLGLSLVLAAARADPGCEVMSIPGAVSGRHTHLACLFFSPIDRVEAALARRRV